MAPRIVILCAVRVWVVRQALGRLEPRGRNPHYRLCCRYVDVPQNRPGCCRGEECVFSVPGIEAWFIGRAALSLVPVLTELPLLRVILGPDVTCNPSRRLFSASVARLSNVSQTVGREVSKIRFLNFNLYRTWFLSHVNGNHFQYLVYP